MKESQDTNNTNRKDLERAINDFIQNSTIAERVSRTAFLDHLGCSDEDWKNYVDNDVVSDVKKESYAEQKRGSKNLVYKNETQEGEQKLRQESRRKIGF